MHSAIQFVAAGVAGHQMRRRAHLLQDISILLCLRREAAKENRYTNASCAGRMLAHVRHPDAVHCNSLKMQECMLMLQVVSKDCFC